jgi:hypothetical protein
MGGCDEADRGGTAPAPALELLRLDLLLVPWAEQRTGGEEARPGRRQQRSHRGKQAPSTLGPVAGHFASGPWVPHPLDSPTTLGASVAAGTTTTRPPEAFGVGSGGKCPQLTSPPTLTNYREAVSSQIIEAERSVDHEESMGNHSAAECSCHTVHL